jgi:hypothetical protein
MKRLLISSVVLTLLSITMILFQLSFTKEATAQTKTTLTKEQILVAKTWKVDKLHHVISGQYSSYTNGGTNNTGINYNIMRFTFSSNGTGTHIDPLGVNYNFTWQFLSSDKRDLQLTLNGITYTWHMLEIADNYLHGSANLILSGNANNIETFRFIQIP